MGGTKELIVLLIPCSTNNIIRSRHNKICKKTTCGKGGANNLRRKDIRSVVCYAREATTPGIVGYGGSVSFIRICYVVVCPWFSLAQCYNVGLCFS